LPAADLEVLTVRAVASLDDGQLTPAHGRVVGACGHEHRASDAALETESVHAYVLAHPDAYFALHCEASGALGRMLIDVAGVRGRTHCAGESIGLHRGARDRHVSGDAHLLAFDLEA